MGKNRRDREAAAESSEKKKPKLSAAELPPPHVTEIDVGSQKDVTKHIKKQEKRLIVVLEAAHLETVKSGKGYGLLNVDDHAGILKRLGRDFSSARPDITHQSLLMLLDSPLNRAGLLQVYIHTAQNVLIEINPQTRIPRTFPRFAGLMVQLLHKFSIKASDSSIKLLKVIKNPVTDHLPVGCKKICLSYSAEGASKASDLVPETDEPICLVVGAIAKGAINVDYTEKEVCIGNFPLSAALTCAKVCSAFEEAWGVI
jgi:rRNA small subunit pseudouridine methyltransferase Nep1